MTLINGDDRVDKGRMVRPAFWASGKVEISQWISFDTERYRLYTWKGAGYHKTACTGFHSAEEAPAFIPNDGKQTPMRGHPVFVAQHATATCCRECIRKWHTFAPGVELGPRQQEYLVDVIMTWIERELEAAGDKIILYQRCNDK